MRSSLIAAVLCLTGLAALGQEKVPVAAPASASNIYAGEAFIVEQSDTANRYNADGTGEQDVAMRIKVQSEAGARAFSVLSFAYASATQAVQFQSVRVTHPDGTSMETPASDAIDMPAPVTQQAPLYSDLKVLQLPVRGLRAGDTLSYTARLQRKTAEAPSQFWDNFSFVKNAVMLSQTLTLDVPADKYLQVWSPTVKPVTSTNAGRRIYRWSGSQLKPTQKKDDSAAAPTDNKPSVAWTTFRSWQEVGDWYRSLAIPRTVPTDALRAQANEITRDAKTPEEQVQAIYNFVATRIRYIGIDFGVGRYEPHAAPEVLANQYGDCKDKDTLLEALLHAKGFTTAPALIGVGIDAIPELPSPGLFNHVITTATLPSGEIWMDSTPETAPFRLLISQIRDKQALVIPTTGVAALERTPAQAPFPFVDHFEATATLKADGELNGHVDINDRSDSEIVLRAIARNLAPAQWDRGSQYVASLLGFSGTTSNSSFARADDFSQPMHLSYDYTRKPFGDWGSFRIVPLFPVVTLPESPDKQPSAEFDLGAPRTEVALSQIHLPANFGADLPDAVHVKTPFATFDKTYTLEGGLLVAKRTIVVLQAKLPATSWKDYKKFADDVSVGQESWIQLTDTGVAGQGPHPPKPVVSNPAAAQLITQAYDLAKSSNWSAATKKLDEAKEIQPQQPYLWSNYGFIAMGRKKTDEAKKDCRRELELHPDESSISLFCAGYLARIGDDHEAISVLVSAFKSDPAQEEIATFLSLLQAKSSLPEAIATLRTAVVALPASHGLAVSLANLLIRDHQNAEAAAILKKQLDGTEDPLLLNNAGYALAETGTDLALAEQKVRQALQTLTTQTSQASIGEANAQSFQRASLLVATWDTLGYILLKENKFEEAGDYIEPAWANRISPDIGEHYGELLEKLGKPVDALRIYRSAIAGINGNTSPEFQKVKESIARLQKAGTKSNIDVSVKTLQDERTFKLELKSAPPSYVSATFRLQFSAAATPDVLRVGGDSSLDEASDAIRNLHLPTVVPPHSTARMLRDAVVSCSPGKKDCFFVLMPLGGIAAENTTN